MLVLPTWPLRSFISADMADILPSEDLLLLNRIGVMLLHFPLFCLEHLIVSNSKFIIFH